MVCHRSTGGDTGSGTWWRIYPSGGGIPRSFAGNADIYKTFCNEVHKYNAFQNKL